jgi:hypothetical protein
VVRSVLLSAALLASLAPVLPAQNQPGKISVKFDCQCDDRVGMLFATEVRDLISKSPRYRLVQTLAPHGGSDWVHAPEMHLDVISFDALNSGDYAAFSEAITVGEELFLSHRVQVCGLKSVRGCAQDTFAAFDAAVQKLRQGAAR